MVVHLAELSQLLLSSQTFPISKIIIGFPISISKIIIGFLISITIKIIIGFPVSIFPCFPISKMIVDFVFSYF